MPPTSVLLPYLTASSLGLVSLCLASLPAGYWLQHPRRPFPLALYIFICLAGGVGILAILLLQNGWYAGILGLLAGLIVLGLAYRQSPPKKFRRTLLLSSLALGVATLFGIPALSFGLTQHIQNQTTQVQAADLQKVDASLTTQADKAHDSLVALQDSLVQASATTLFSVLSAGLVNHQLQFLTITNAQGLVIARAARPQASGDLITTRLSWLSSVLNGQSVQGLALDELGQPVVVAAIPLHQNGQLSGMLFGGYSLTTLTPPTPTSDPIALYNGATLVTATPADASETALFETSDTATWIQTAPSQSTPIASSSATGDFQASIHRLTTLDGNDFRLLSLRHASF